MSPDDPIVKRGTWLYAGTVLAAIRITRADWSPGSADDEDPPEHRDDREAETFNVWYESPPGSGRFPAGGGQYPSLSAAVQGAESSLGSNVDWL